MEEGTGAADPEWVAQDGVGTPDGFARLWTPHRLAYIKDATDTGCPFCRIADLGAGGDEDRDSLFGRVRSA